MNDREFNSLEKIYRFLGFDAAVIVVSIVLLSWVLYKLLLRNISFKRHKLMADSFRNLFGHTFVMLLAYGAYRLMDVGTVEILEVRRLVQYFGLFVIFYGLLVIVKASRIFIFESMFVGHMKAPVPLLLVNLFTIMIAVSLFFWAFAEIFDVRLTPLLATSAVLSLVLGLALQDTLGNLFAGISLQIDKAYEIGDWVEVASGGPKVAGQIREISWRATVLVSFTDEQITIPNRVMAQAQIFNYSSRLGPVIRSLIFKLPYNSDVEKARDIVVQIAQKHSETCDEPAPMAFITEAHESWISLRLVYYINDFGRQFVIADDLLTACISKLKAAGISFAAPRLAIEKSSPQQSVTT